MGGGTRINIVSFFEEMTIIEVVTGQQKTSETRMNAGRLKIENGAWQRLATSEYSVE